MSQYCIISVCQRTINIINCPQKSSSLITEQRAVKEKMRISFNIEATLTKWIQSILKTMFEFMLKQMTWSKNQGFSHMSRTCHVMHK